MEAKKNSKSKNRPTGENGIPENLLTPVEPTFAANMERVVELATTTHLGEAFNSAAQPYLAYIAERMSLSEKQALLLSLFLEKSSDRCILMSDFAQMLDCRTIRIISLMSEVDALVARGLVCRRTGSDGTLYYRMLMEEVMAFKDNKVYTPKSTKGLSPEEFFDAMVQIFNDYDVGDRIVQKLDTLVEESGLFRVEIDASHASGRVAAAGQHPAVRRHD